MKIIILGAGQVGASVAANLASEANDITVVDEDAAVLQDLQDRLDIRTVTAITCIICRIELSNLIIYIGVGVGKH